MKEEKFNNSGHRMRVLVSPLDWGLGHATRCIPIIKELLRLNCEVFVGADGASKILLQKEFPQLTFLLLKGYRMQYSRKKYWLAARLLFQLPKMALSVYKEHQWLKRVIRENAIDAVIADNRLGLYHSAVPCIYITHQLTIRTGNRFTERLAQKIHYHFINKFQACWVPDAEGENNLAGILSHPTRLPKIPVLYLGPLSRFEKIDVEKKYDLAIIISGPEPQRTVFEDLLLKELEDYKGSCLFVRGLPNNKTIHQFVNSSIEMHDHLSSQELNPAILRSGMIISRSGYTTVMDLVRVQKKAILVPTPGQTEQEYLAKFLMKKKIFSSVEQKNFSLPEAIRAAADFDFCFPEFNYMDYKKVVENFINQLPSR